MQPVFDATHYADTIVCMAGNILQRGDAQAGLEAIRAVQAYAEANSRQYAACDDLIACHAGCAHCCIVNVAVLPPEAENVTAYLLADRTNEQLLDLYQALDKLDRETRMMDEEERIMARIKCAFLDSSGCCSIYPVRPLLCRAVTSTDAGTCRDALSMIALGEEQPITANLLQKDIFEIAFSRFGQALKNYDMEHRSQRLTHSVRTILPLRMKNRPDRSEHVH